MTETPDPLPVMEHEEIDRGKATRPWTLNEVTVNDLDHIDGIHGTVDTLHVPWRAQEPIDEVHVLFTVDPRVVERRYEGVGDVAARVAATVETDPRLAEYVDFERLTPTAVAAQIDDGRTRVRVSWSVSGGEQ